MSKTAISIQGLTKQYRLGSVGTGMLSQDLNRWWSKARGKEDPTLEIGMENKLEEIGGDFVYALKDINLEVKQGEILGVIGKNGAGKSTLLKILSRVTSPTSGTVDMYGRVASLLEVGTGFHPELTGRENIFLNGAIMGMSKQEIKLKFDEIVDFAGIGKYIDTPVKRYSSGMYVRLGFAVAAYLDTEILIFDEVLAVGDFEFQKKALGKMHDASKNEGRTVLFVSHNMGAVKSLCTHGILLSQGKIIKTGNIQNVIDQYLESQVTTKSNSWFNKLKSDPIYFKKIEIKQIIGYQPNLKIELSVELESTEFHKACFLAFDINDVSETPVFQTIPTLNILHSTSSQEYTIIIDLPPLIPGEYSVSAWIGPHNTETFSWLKNIIYFNIEESPKKDWTFPFAKDHGNIIMTSYVQTKKNN